MPLESLLELVETLRKRIDEHGAALRQNEMLTRYALIDPLLTELGWNLSDPEAVVPEDTSGRNSGRPDYVLHNDGIPAMVVEAKKLDSVDFRNSSTQAFEYARDPGRQAQYFATTDGQRWEVFDLKKPLDESKVVSFNLVSESPSEVCLKALALWRPSVIDRNTGEGHAPILRSIVEPKTVSEQPIVSEVQPDSSAQAAPSVSGGHVVEKSANVLRDNSEWVSLSNLNPQPFSKPAEVLLPDNSRVKANSWADAIVEIARWLYIKNYLKKNNCRVQRATRYVISDTPRHPNGKEFAQTKEVESLYIESNYNSSNLATNSRLIIAHAGQDPVNFKVRLSS